VPNAAIVGYTNAGKSSLLRRLTGADVLVENALFATLDTTTRKIDLPNKQPLLLTDTVGFIRKLPHQLVESFNATLEEAVMADFLVHLLDASHPRVLEFYGTTMKVLSELGADAKKTLVVFNKIDQVDDPLTRAMLRSHHPEALFISVHTGEGIDQLVEQLGGLVGEGTREILLHLPHDRTDLLARLHREGRVEQTDYEEEFIRIRASVPERFRRTLEPFIIL
jgi:GTP-binding protein HflX